MQTKSSSEKFKIILKANKRLERQKRSLGREGAVGEVTSV